MLSAEDIFRGKTTPAVDNLRRKKVIVGMRGEDDQNYLVVLGRDRSMIRKSLRMKGISVDSVTYTNSRKWKESKKKMQRMKEVDGTYGESSKATVQEDNPL